MKIEIEYPVITTGTPLRTNKERTVILKDTATFDVPEYFLDEAPVGFRWERRRNIHILRMINGQLYEPIAGQEAIEKPDYWKYSFKFQVFEGFWFKSLEPQAPLEFHNNPKLIRLREEAGMKLGTAFYPPEVVDVVASRVVYQQLNFRKDVELRDIVEEEFFTARSQMQDAVDNLALIGGALWRRCQPPMLTTQFSSSPNGPRSLQHDILVRPYYEDLKYVVESLGGLIKLVHNVADGDIASHVLGDILTKHGYNMQAPDFLNSVDLSSVEVFEPDLIEFPSADFSILHAADLMVSAIGSRLTQKLSSMDDRNAPGALLRRNLDRIGTDHLILYKNLIDSLEFAFANKVVDENLVNSLDSIDEQFFVHLDKHLFPGFAREILDYAMESWNERTVSIEQIAPTKPFR
jgi:hypothetical protein